MDDRRSHWPIYDVVPIERIKAVSETVRKATVDTVKNKDGLVVYFPSKSGGNSAEYLERRKK